MLDQQAGLNPGTPSIHSKTFTFLIEGVRSPNVNAANSIWSGKKTIKMQENVMLYTR